MLVLPFILATLTTTAELNALSSSEFAAQQPFALTGTVTSVLYGNHFIIADATGRTHIRIKRTDMPSCGDLVALSGLTEIDAYHQEQTAATNVSVIGASTPSEVVNATVGEISGGIHDYANVQVAGRVIDVFRDDIDANWTYLIICNEGENLYVTVPGEWTGFDRFARAHVSVIGTVVPNHCGARRFIGPHVETSGAEAITMLAPSENPPSDVPPLEYINHLRPSEVVRLGPHTLDGRVLATWGGHSALIESRGGEVHRLNLMACARSPAIGSFIRATGLPETDLYRINLSKATCQLIDTPPDAPPMRAPRTDALNYQIARRHWLFHGNTVMISGCVLAEPDARTRWRAIILCNGERLSVDISNTPDCAEELAIGTVIEVTGCGLLEIENWRTGATLPFIKETVVIIRTPSDIRVISRPPWWTPERLLTVISALAGLLVVIFTWNRVLKRLVERRGRQLVREELARTTAEFRTVERTRIAAEMHDSLSQSLTAISCQIDAMDAARTRRPERLEHHLLLARRMLDSSRAQLRNCLWDLRSDALNERDVATAIRKSVRHHAGDARLEINFPVSRTAFSDTVFHEIICIVRELVANAARHGHATLIRIAGQLEGDRLTLSVSDNGCGFDPESRPGSAEGHFGLLGVTERIERLNGELTINSAPGGGAVFTLTMTTAT